MDSNKFVPVERQTKLKILGTAIPFLESLMMEAVEGCAGIFDGTIKTISINKSIIDPSQTPGVVCWAMLKRAWLFAE